jgi:hypothetical protein
MPLTASVIEDLHDCALNALDHGLTTCAISDEMFHQTTPDLPFDIEEILQLVRYMQRQNLFAIGVRLENIPAHVEHLLLLISRTNEELHETVAMMRACMDEGMLTIIGLS